VSEELTREHHVSGFAVVAVSYQHGRAGALSTILHLVEVSRNVFHGLIRYKMRRPRRTADLTRPSYDDFSEYAESCLDVHRMPLMPTSISPMMLCSMVRDLLEEMMLSVQTLGIDY
jgi:hypothetical protein